MCNSRYFIAIILRKLRNFNLRLKGYRLEPSVIIEGAVRLDRLNPKGVIIGANTLIARGSVILSHSHVHRTKENLPIFMDTYIGDNCFIGNNVIVNPGVKIGNNVIIGDGSVVTKDMPDFCFAAGNPARVIKENVGIEKYGTLKR